LRTPSVSLEERWKRQRVVISASALKGGLGSYSKRLFSLGLFDSLLLFKNNADVPEEGYGGVISPPFRSRLAYAAHVYYSFYFPTRWSSAVKGMALVHYASPDWFHLAKYNESSYGTVHDIFPITWPSSYAPHYRRFFMREMAAAGSLRKVVAISDYVKEQLLERFPDLRVVRIHQWTEPDFAPRDKGLARKRLGLPESKKLVLSVGTEEPRKNVEILPKVLEQLGEGFALVRIGGFEKLGSVKGAIFLRDVPFDLMPLYYNAADVLVAPSLDEGFDAPLIEAINSGTAVVASDIPVHREVLRGMGRLVDPRDVRGWVEAIRLSVDETVNWSGLREYYGEERARREYESLYSDD